jgi:hypothetical protein
MAFSRVRQGLEISNEDSLPLKMPQPRGKGKTFVIAECGFRIADFKKLASLRRGSDSCAEKQSRQRGSHRAPIRIPQSEIRNRLGT